MEATMIAKKQKPDLTKCMKFVERDDDFDRAVMWLNDAYSRMQEAKTTKEFVDALREFSGWAQEIDNESADFLDEFRNAKEMLKRVDEAARAGRVELHVSLKEMITLLGTVAHLAKQVKASGR